MAAFYLSIMDPIIKTVEAVWYASIIYTKLFIFIFFFPQKL